MLEVIIAVDGQYYTGEKEENYKSQSKGVHGWDYGNSEASVLGFSPKIEDAHRISGAINVKSHIDRVMMRIRDENLSFERIEIIKIKE